MDMINFLYWLKGYLEANDDIDMDSVIQINLKRVLEEYEKNKLNNVTATLKPYEINPCGRVTIPTDCKQFPMNYLDSQNFPVEHHE